MRDVEPQRREQRILFVLGAEHALRDVAAAARLRARIPGGPPVHRDVDQEGDHRHPGGVQIGDKVEDGALRRAARVVDGGELGLHAVDAADGAHGEDREHRDHAHLDDELKHVGDQHAPQAGEGGDERRERDHSDDDGESFEFSDAEHQLQDFDHRQVHPSENDAVDGDAEVKRAEAAQERGGLAGVADFGEFDVGHDAGAAPQAGIKEDREHAARDEVPPQPVARDASHRDHAGDRERRVGREGGGNHGRTGQPPGDVAPGEEKLIDAFAGAGFVVKADGQVKEEVEGDYQPVDGGELHK